MSLKVSKSTKILLCFECHVKKNIFQCFRLGAQLGGPKLIYRAGFEFDTYGLEQVCQTHFPRGPHWKKRITPRARRREFIDVLLFH